MRLKYYYWIVTILGLIGMIINYFISYEKDVEYLILCSVLFLFGSLGLMINRIRDKAENQTSEDKR